MLGVGNLIWSHWLSEQHAPCRTLEYIWSVEIVTWFSCILIKLVSQICKANLFCVRNIIRTVQVFSNRSGFATGKWMTISFLTSVLVQLSTFNWLVPFSSCFPRTLDNSIMAAVPLDASAAPNTQASRWLPSNTSSSTKDTKNKNLYVSDLIKIWS